MPKRPESKEPSYQIGIPLDAPDDSALQKADPYDHEETAQDYHPAPPVEKHSTEVSLPQSISFEEEAAPQPIPTTEVALPPQPPPQKPARPVRQQPRAQPKSEPLPAQQSSRSSRRVAAASGRAPVSSRRLAAGDRGSWQKVLLWGGIGLLLALVAFGCIIVLARSESPDHKAAVEAMAEAGRQLELVRAAVANRRSTEARKAYDTAFSTLTKTPQLGGAVPEPPQGAPVDRPLALQAAAMRGELEPFAERIAAIEKETLAEAGLAALKARCAALGDPATDLDQLERDLVAYIANPVDPKAGPSAVNAAAFPRLVTDANLRLPQIATERDRRRQARAVVPVREAGGEIDGLIQQDRFGDALARLDALRTQFPEADFAPLRARVEDAAAKAWRSAKAQFDTRIADWKSPGAAESQRKTSLAAAKERMNLVVQRFGMPLYVDQARALLTPLP